MRVARREACETAHAEAEDRAVAAACRSPVRVARGGHKTGSDVGEAWARRPSCLELVTRSTAPLERGS